VGGHLPELHIFPDEVGQREIDRQTDRQRERDLLNRNPTRLHTHVAEQEGDDTVVENVDLTKFGKPKP